MRKLFITISAGNYILRIKYLYLISASDETIINQRMSVNLCKPAKFFRSKLNELTFFAFANRYTSILPIYAMNGAPVRVYLSRGRAEHYTFFARRE